MYKKYQHSENNVSLIFDFQEKNVSLFYKKKIILKCFKSTIFL